MRGAGGEAAGGVAGGLAGPRFPRFAQRVQHRNPNGTPPRLSAEAGQEVEGWWGVPRWDTTPSLMMGRPAHAWKWKNKGNNAAPGYGKTAVPCTVPWAAGMRSPGTKKTFGGLRGKAQ